MIKCQSNDTDTRLMNFTSSRPRRLSQAIMPAAGCRRQTHAALVTALLVSLAAAGAESCQIGSGSQCEKAPFVPGHNLAGEGFDVVRMRRTGAYVINVKDHLTDNNTCTLCPNRFQSGQVRTATPIFSTLCFVFSILSCLNSQSANTFVCLFLHYLSIAFFLTTFYFSSQNLYTRI